MSLGEGASVWLLWHFSVLVLAASGHLRFRLGILLQESHVEFLQLLQEVFQLLGARKDGHSRKQTHSKNKYMVCLNMLGFYSKLLKPEGI